MRLLIALIALLLMTFAPAYTQTVNVETGNPFSEVGQLTGYSAALGDAVVTVAQADLCDGTTSDTQVSVGVPYRVVARMNADTTHARVMVGAGTSQRTAVGPDVVTTPGACVVVEVTAQTAGSYTVQVMARNVVAGKTTSETPSDIKTITAAVPVAPTPGKPTIRIIGTITVAGKTLPATFDIASIQTLAK